MIFFLGGGGGGGGIGWAQYVLIPVQWPMMVLARDTKTDLFIQTP